MNTTNTAICTLFEKVYHLGLGVFTNSVYAQGYRGVIYAGYRGALPPWANAEGLPPGSDFRFEATPGLNIQFVYLEMKEHLTNIKPDFMLDIWERYGTDWDQLFYFDPDIVVKCKWHRFTEWAALGVAMCEDMNSPVPTNHPRRLQWRDYYRTHGIDLVSKNSFYVNGGFLGVDVRYKHFLEVWKDIQRLMKLETGITSTIGIADRWNMFHLTDQDALNITKDLFPDVSIMEKSAMDFGKQGYVMSHYAVGLRHFSVQSVNTQRGV
jgi:hypothetical protein